MIMSSDKLYKEEALDPANIILDDRYMPVFRHFKGEYYVVLGTTDDSETGELVVIYKAIYGIGKEHNRKLDMFISPVDKEKYPNVEQYYRFEYCFSIKRSDK